MEKWQRYYLIACIAFGIFGLCFCLCIYCEFQSLELAINVIDASADFIVETKRVIAVPLFHLVLNLFIIIIWLWAFAYVLSLNDIVSVKSVPQGRTIVWKGNYAYMAWYMFFGLLWITSFVEYAGSFIVIVAASTYYFNSNKDHEGDAEVWQGFKWAYVNHFGSIAMAAFIIAVIKFIKFVVMTIVE